MTDKIVDNLLNYDVIGDAENLYGELSQDNNEGFAYAMDMLQSRSEQIRRIMLARSDTHDRMTVDEYLKIAEGAGFKRIIEEDFNNRDGKPNKLVILWHPDGVLLKLDTYSWYDGKTTINSANMYYNIKMLAPFQERWSKTSSGHMYWSGPITPDDKNLTNIWVGDHDVREALLYKLDGLRSVGVFVSEWVESDHLYLVHYMDLPEEEKDWKKRSALLQEAVRKRFATMPKEIGEMLLKVYKSY